MKVFHKHAKNYKVLVQAIKQTKPLLRTIAGPVPFLFDEKTLENELNFTLDLGWGPIDLLGEIPGVVSYEDLMKNAI
ncbi:MAG: hypothetical protein KDK66_01550 [Deltaproteobacteria bacterium]|nr:hypothetical protein [Deltaproteobacteria bacterium]